MQAKVPCPYQKPDACSQVPRTFSQGASEFSRFSGSVALFDQSNDPVNAPKRLIWGIEETSLTRHEAVKVGCGDGRANEPEKNKSADTLDARSWRLDSREFQVDFIPDLVQYTP